MVGCALKVGEKINAFFLKLLWLDIYYSNEKSSHAMSMCLQPISWPGTPTEVPRDLSLPYTLSSAKMFVMTTVLE